MRTNDDEHWTAPDARLAQWGAALASGASILVRPTTPYPGLDAVAGLVSSVAGGPLVVTDLDALHDTLTAHTGDSGGAVIAFHTSGSTGHPKCVVYRRDVVDRHALAIAERLGLTDSGLTYVALVPPRFAYGLSILHSHHLTGVPVSFCDATWGLPDVHRLAENSEGELALYVLPQHVPLLAASGLDAARLRRILVAGGRLTGTAARTLAARFPRADLINMYGQAEMGPRLSTWQGPLVDFVEGSLGRPLPGVHLELLDEAGDPVPVGVTGRIHVRTPYAMSWIVAHPYQSLTPGPRDDTAVNTGDLGRATPTGEFLHEGRGDHILNVAGTKVDAGRLRAVVEETFAPVLVRVRSRPARVGGDTVPLIEIVPGDTPVTGGGVRRALHAEIGSLAGLCAIEIVEHLHLTESGK